MRDERRKRMEDGRPTPSIHKCDPYPSLPQMSVYSRCKAMALYAHLGEAPKAVGVFCRVQLVDVVLVPNLLQDLNIRGLRVG